MTAEEKHIDIVFDGPPGRQPGRFVEVENGNGESIKYGEWIQREDGYWVLRIPDPNQYALTIAEKAVEEERKQIRAEGVMFGAGRESAYKAILTRIKTLTET